jgi:hypothetical protein
LPNRLAVARDASVGVVYSDGLMGIRSLPSRLAAFGGLVLAALALTHHLTYLVAYGTGAAYSLAMRTGGHDAYWDGFVLAAIAAAASLAVVATLQLRRLHRLAARAQRLPILVEDAGIRTLVDSIATGWLRLTAATALAFLLQENLEGAIAGEARLPGLMAIGGEHQAAIPILAFVTFGVAFVAALYRWRRDILLAVSRAPARRPRASTVVERPRTHDLDRLAGRSVGHHGLRAPPIGTATLS